MSSTLYRSMIERMRDGLQKTIDTHEAAHDQGHEVVSPWFNIAEHEPDVMEFMLYRKHKEFHPGERPVRSPKTFGMMRSMVERGMGRGEIGRRDVRVASTCLFGGPICMITSCPDGILEKPLHDYPDDVRAC